MKIGILTGGGDCPGLNAVIRAAVRKGIFHYGDEFIGFLEGWRGVLEDKTTVLGLDQVAGILPRGGTILRTSRTNPDKHQGGVARCAENLKKHEIDALIAVGGDDTMRIATKRRPQDHRQRPERHRFLLRIRYRGERRHFGHRPRAHHRRSPCAGHGGRGDGARLRLDRGV